MSRQTVNDLTPDTPAEPRVLDEVEDVADVVLGWSYRPKTVLPQRLGRECLGRGVLDLHGDVDTRSATLSQLAHTQCRIVLPRQLLV